MSIADFSRGMRSEALKAFRTADIGKGKHINPLFYTVGSAAVRAHEQSSDRTTFIIDKATINYIRETLIEDYPELPSTTALMARAKAINNVYTSAPKVRRVKKSDGGTDTVVVFENIEFKNGIDSILKEIFKTGSAQKDTTIRNSLVGESGIFQKGHVIGVATNLLDQSANEISGIGNESAQEKKEIVAATKVINRLISDLRAADIATSNYSSEDSYNMLGSYIKTPHKYLVELQLSKSNTSAGSKVGSDLANLRNILKQDADDIASTLLKSIKTDSIFRNSIIKMKGSPSMLQMIEAAIREVLDPLNTIRSIKKFFQSQVPITQFTNKINVDKSKVKQSLQKEIARLEQQKATLVRDIKGKARRAGGQFASIANLQILMQARLAEQIKANMGDGSRRDILNLQSGRFAETVQIENTRLQKDNVIAVFYSYMKYPYATFSKGGAQSHPISRDPATLINRSIREIASSLVTNRLRLSST